MLADADFAALRLWALNTRTIWLTGIAIWPSSFTSAQNERLRTLARATPQGVWLVWVFIFSVMWFVACCGIMFVAMLPVDVLLARGSGDPLSLLFPFLLAISAVMLSSYIVGSIVGTWIAGRMIRALMPLPPLMQADGDAELFDATRRQIGRLTKFGLASAAVAMVLPILILVV